MGLWDRLFGSGAPEGFTGALEPEEHVAAAAPSGEGWLVATPLGLWLPEQPPRRVGWHLVSKATWDGKALTVTEAVEDEVVTAETGGTAVLLRDLRPVRYAVERPGKLTDQVHQRVTQAIRQRRRDNVVGAWFLLRKIPGRDGAVLHVRADAGAAPDRVRAATLEQVTALATGAAHWDPA